MFDLNFSSLGPYLHLFASGTWVTIKASILIAILGSIIGVFIGVLRVMPFGPVRKIAATYIYVIRGTPMLVQLFLIYFGLPSFGINLSGFTAGILGVSLNAGGYIGEIVRGGIEGVPKGQWEAGQILGLSYLQKMRFIILPQAIRSMLPALGNEIVTIVKETSLLSTLAITELTMVGSQVRSVTYASFETFFLVGAIYLVLTTAMGLLLKSIEHFWQVR